MCWQHHIPAVVRRSCLSLESSGTSEPAAAGAKGLAGESAAAEEDQVSGEVLVSELPEADP